MIPKSVWQLQTAKNKFSQLVKLAIDGEPQLVTRNGAPAVYIISAETYDAQLKNKGKGLKDILLSSPHKALKLDLSRDKDVGREVEL